ncbi:hypothetical protein Tco_0449202 [Tanacetum coccineum]
MKTLKLTESFLMMLLLPLRTVFEFGKYNMTLKTDIKPKEATFQVVLDALALTPFYQAFIITAEICPKIPGQEFEDLLLEHDILSFIRALGHSGDIIYLTDEDLLFQIENKEAKKTNKMSYPRFTKIIIDYFVSKYQSISRRNKMFWHTNRDDTMFTSMRCISGHEYTQVYGTILPKELTNQAMLESNAYKTYYAFASGKKTPKPKYIQKKANYDTSPKQKPVQATKAEQLKLATKRSKTQFHGSYTSDSGDGVDTQSKVPDEQHLKTTGADEGTDTIPGVLDVPIYESKSEKDSWGDSEDEDEDDENDSDDISNEGDDDNDGINGNDDDANDNDKQEGDDMNDDDEETDSDRPESDIIKIPILDQSTTEYHEEEEEAKFDDEETMNDDKDDEVTKEFYEDVNVNLGYEDTEMTNADQVASKQQNVSQESGFEQVEEDAHVTLTPLLNLENPSPTDNEVASLMETLARHAMAVPENTSGFTTTIPPPPPFFNPLLQQATPTLTPTTSEATTSFPSLLDFSFVFKFNDRVTNLEKDLSEIKQVD